MVRAAGECPVGWGFESLRWHNKERTMYMKVPTGDILIIDGEKGKLECLSIGDYGKERNIKADFLGLKKEINGVDNGNMMPLSEKWVITISTQYGCSMNCKFCDVPLVGAGINATRQDMTKQVISCLELHPEVKGTKRLNVHYARMGEPTFNLDVIEHAVYLRKEIRPYIGRSLVHPVVSTMLPKNNKNLMTFLSTWVSDIKNDEYRGDAGLQFSINSTSDKKREWMFSGNSLSLRQIAKIGYALEKPKGRKFALNFALFDRCEIDANVLATMFDSRKFMVKLTPIHKTVMCNKNSIDAGVSYSEYSPYKDIEESLKKAGFDVLVFVPSEEEDSSRITCGNAILADAC